MKCMCVVKLTWLKKKCKIIPSHAVDIKKTSKRYINLANLLRILMAYVNLNISTFITYVFYTYTQAYVLCVCVCVTEGHRERELE